MKQYITPEEAVTLSKQCRLPVLLIAQGIYDAYSDKRSSDIAEFGVEWFQAGAMTAVFNAGRVAGIRQERERRKARAAV